MDNKQLSKRIINDTFNTGDMKAIDELVASDWTSRDPYVNQFGTGPSALKNFASTYRKAFPDLKITVDNQLSDGDYVVTAWTANGTNGGDFMGMPATNKKAKVSGITIDRFRNGKIVETWTSWDMFGLVQQLGLDVRGKAPSTRPPEAHP